MVITKKGYMRRFVKLFMLKTGLNYEYAKDNALYFAEDCGEYDSRFIEMDVDEAISNHF